jgi:hypothetical protein
VTPGTILLIVACAMALALVVRAIVTFLTRD